MTFAAKARKAVRAALARHDCHHADYWLRQLGLRDPAGARARVTKKLQTRLKRCYKKR